MRRNESRMVFWEMLLLAWALLLPRMGWSADVPHKPWHFTKSDYARLRAAGHELTMAPDSQWLPAPYATALLATLRWALDPATTPAVTEEVSFWDFFHGHISCPKRVVGPDETIAPISPVLESWTKTYTRVLRQLKNIAVGPEKDELDEETLRTFGDTVTLANDFSRNLLETVERERLCPQMAIVFHTFENTKPEDWAYGDPRRNLITPVANPIPGPLILEDQGAASNFTVDYREVVYFSFLIDEKGAVHAVAGTEDYLSPLLGRVFHQRDWKKF